MENEVVYLYLDDIIPNRFQPRENFDEQAMKELAVSIKEHGVIQPIVVRKLGEKYEIIAGERRYKASTMAGLAKIPAIIRNLDDKESSKVALIENLQRKDLTPIEEARTYQKILELDALTQEELAKTMGKSQSAVSNKLRLLSLTDEVQDALLREKISERHARGLLNVEDPKKQVELLNKIITTKMTVRELDEEIKKLGVPIDSAPPESVTINPPSLPTNVDVDKIRRESTDINDMPISKNIDVLLRPNTETSNNGAIGGSGLLAGLPADINTEERNTETVINPILPQINPIEEKQKEIEPIIKPITNNVTNSIESLTAPEITKPAAENVVNPIEPLTTTEVVNSVNQDTNTIITGVKSDVNKLKESYKSIDVDEFDFDDFYQIIIRIDKN